MLMNSNRLTAYIEKQYASNQKWITFYKAMKYILIAGLFLTCLLLLLGFDFFTLLIALLYVALLIFVDRHFRFITKINRNVKRLMDDADITYADLREGEKKLTDIPFAKHHLLYYEFFQPAYYLFGIIEQKETYSVVIFSFKDNEDVLIATIQKGESPEAQYVRGLYQKMNKFLTMPLPRRSVYKIFMLSMNLSDEG